jgi:hypothetical protein
MSEFVLIFRRDYKTLSAQPSPEQMQEHLGHWQNWFGKLKDEDRLTRPVQRIDQQGRISGPYNSVQTGPYTEATDSIGGLVFIQAQDYDEAVALAKTCPILELNGSVEIRMGL